MLWYFICIVFAVYLQMQITGKNFNNNKKTLDMPLFLTAPIILERLTIKKSRWWRAKKSTEINHLPRTTKRYVCNGRLAGKRKRKKKQKKMTQNRTTDRIRTGRLLGVRVCKGFVSSHLRETMGSRAERKSHSHANTAAPVTLQPINKLSAAR